MICPHCHMGYFDAPAKRAPRKPGDDSPRPKPTRAGRCWCGKFTISAALRAGHVCGESVVLLRKLKLL